MKLTRETEGDTGRTAGPSWGIPNLASALDESFERLLDDLGVPGALWMRQPLSSCLSDAQAELVIPLALGQQGEIGRIQAAVRVREAVEEHRQAGTLSPARERPGCDLSRAEAEKDERWSRRATS